MNIKASAAPDMNQQLVMRQDNVNQWRVLIVDDVEDNVTVLSAILELNGATIEKASGGIEGMEKVLDFQPSLILLDLAMPDVDGWDMKRFLDATPNVSHVPVIAVTAHQSYNVRNQLKQDGFAGMIAKPFSVMTIIDEICDMLTTGRTSEPLRLSS